MARKKEKGIVSFFKERRTILLFALIIGSLICISTLGIQQGLDLQGGSLIQIELEKPVDASTMNAVTNVLDKRLNIYGVKDIQVRSSGNQNVIVEIAGVKPDEVANIVGSPGKFEAKIDNKTVLTGADIVSVDASIVNDVQYAVPFKVSVDGANRFAKVAKGKAGAEVNMYLDNKLITSPEVSAELAGGTPSTQVQVSGSAGSKEAAQTQAKELETLLKSGSLPVQVKIVGISSVSAELGEKFTNGALFAGLLSVLVISFIIIIRYRNPILVIPIIVTTLAELIIVLGVASIIKWNMDLSAIAGIIASIGTGVDDQIIITDEVLFADNTKKTKRTSKKIESAFFIIFASAGTLIAAMLPLGYIGFSRGYTGIGMLSGFAFTTVLGVIIGILFTRPVYAKFIENIVVKNK